jgi:hypothetical protein
VHRNALFVKTYLASLLPYPTEKLVKEEEVDKEKLNQLYRSCDLSPLESIF